MSTCRVNLVASPHFWHFISIFCDSARFWQLFLCGFNHVTTFADVVLLAELNDTSFQIRTETFLMLSRHVTKRLYIENYHFMKSIFNITYSLFTLSFPRWQDVAQGCLKWGTQALLLGLRPKTARSRWPPSRWHRLFHRLSLFGAKKKVLSQGYILCSYF